MTDMLQNKYQCPKGEMVFVSSDKLHNHKKNQCELVNIESFPVEPTIYRPAQNKIKAMLTKYSIKSIDHYLDHFIVYDFEAILKPTLVKHGENTTFTNDHVPVPVSVADSLSEEVRCFVNDDPKALLTDVFNYIASVVVKIQKYNVGKYWPLLRKIITAHGLTGKQVPGVDLDKTITNVNSSIGVGKQRSDYDKQIGQVPVIGFNSGRYDINLIKNDLFAVIGTDNIKSVIKTLVTCALQRRK